MRLVLDFGSPVPLKVLGLVSHFSDMPRSGENKDEKKNKRKSKGEMENEILQSLLEGGRYEN